MFKSMLAAAGLVLTTASLQAQMRPDVGGPSAAVVSDHPLASAAGADVLKRGGNAMDAAITMAAVLGVVRPHMNGLGGDNFILYREAKSGRVYALNGSGRAGGHATLEYMRGLGHTRMPQSGVASATVPGVVQAWEDALARFGTIKLKAALRPAIRYAENGFPVSTTLSEDIAAARTALSADKVAAAIFLPNGNAPEPGTILRQPELANSYKAIANRGAKEFYRGKLGKQIAAFVEQERGIFKAADLAAHTSTWQEPISTTFKGLRVFAFPPNSQGMALLMQLNMAEHFDLKAMGHNSPDYLHTLVEIKKLAMADRDKHITDAEHTKVSIEKLISKEYAAELVRNLKARATSNSAPERSGSGDTVFLCVIDEQGNMVAMIQSLYASFGSKRMVPGTGIVLHNRGGLFELDANHINVIAPNKRTYHTLTPHLVLRDDGSPYMAIGTPGGDGQTQTILQVLLNTTVFGMMPQQAVEQARYRSMENGRLLLDAGIPEAVRTALTQRGHEVRVQQTLSSEHGGAQVIWVNHGMKITGADPRREAYGIAW